LETLSLRYQDVLNSLNALNQTIQMITTKSHDQVLYRILRDSEIKRFELCYEVFWKFLKHFIEDKHGLEGASPKLVFRQAYEVGIISLIEFETFLDMVRDRNHTSHIYKEEVADIFAQHVIQYYECICVVMQRCGELL
jgi:nucleotidyltransferase substrate binding protein (TIGR01987 family)